MPRRRLLNVTATGDVARAGYEKEIQVYDATTWGHCLIGDCPIKNIREQEDHEQWCFKFESGGIEFFLPQIELARVLFFHYSYMTRLAMRPSGLKEEFDIQPGDEPDTAEIHILPTCSLPLNPRGNTAQRRVLAWILLDDEVRRSFSSIAQYQLTEGEDLNGYRLWRFRFDPPPLKNVKISLRGQYLPESEVMFVYEIDSVKNLNTQSSKQIEFFDPKLAEQSAGNATRRPDSGVPTEAFQINDDELASSDTGEYQLQVPPVILSFSEPAYTTRKPYDGRRRTRAGKGTEEINLTGDAHTEVSTDEPTIRGEIPSGVFDGVDDQSDDAHLYLHRFEAFVLMVDHLEANGCEVLS